MTKPQHKQQKKSHPQLKPAKGVYLFSKEGVSDHQLVQIAEKEKLKHFCIDKNQRAHYLLLLKILNWGMLPGDIEEKIFGYISESETDITYFYVNEDQHNILKSFLDAEEVCQL